mmetsp:Transcript_28294/g.71534  ORF Transcript_28294/g.71534 Transcript_28294/m.71534 type:complete len:249 (-) Transcript_28294:250-996(-)
MSTSGTKTSELQSMKTRPSASKGSSLHRWLPKSAARREPGMRHSVERSTSTFRSPPTLRRRMPSASASCALPGEPLAGGESAAGVPRCCSWSSCCCIALRCATMAFCAAARDRSSELAGGLGALPWPQASRHAPGFASGLAGLPRTGPASRVGTSIMGGACGGPGFRCTASRLRAGDGALATLLPPLSLTKLRKAIRLTPSGVPPACTKWSKSARTSASASSLGGSSRSRRSAERNSTSCSTPSRDLS